jgi:hypothetical protein
VLRYRRRITPGEIADRDASGGGGLAIDGVHAYPNFLDEAKLWRFVKDGGVDGVKAVPDYLGLGKGGV